MIRRIFVIAGLAALLTLACSKNDGAGATATGEGGAPVKKLYCKINNGCWICPDDNAMKKCILNPVTSGCKPAGISDCP